MKKVVKKPLKKMQGGGVMNTKLKDIPGKVKSATKKVADRFKNMTVGDAADILTSGGYSTMKTISKGVKSLKNKSNSTVPKKKLGGSVKKTRKK